MSNSTDIVSEKYHEHRKDQIPRPPPGLLTHYLVAIRKDTAPKRASTLVLLLITTNSNRMVVELCAFSMKIIYRDSQIRFNKSLSKLSSGTGCKQ
jgi:hypothetical protein